MSEGLHHPTVLVIGGPNGAGKSTCAKTVLGDVLCTIHFVNADTIARGLSLYRPDSVAVEAGRIMIRRIRELADAGTSFAFETTLSGRAHASFLKNLVNAGYRFELLYVMLRSPELAVERVSRRVAGGGHAIPHSDIRRRFHRSAYNLFDRYIPLAHKWEVYDNSLKTYRPVAQGGGGDPPTIAEKGLFDELQRHARDT